jgi:sterol desaturase/sphingolipid hydroxylase (fatty acid hydroxylase superfamily)
MQVAGPTFEEVLRKNFKRVLTYWSQIGTVMGLSAVGLGLISLYMYTRAIGRTDLFMASIDAKSALMIWLVIVLVLMSAFLFLLTVTTLLFWLSASLFHRTPGRLKDVVVWLTLPFLVGFLGYVVVIYYTSGWLPVGQSLLGLLVLFLLSC